MSIRNRDYVSAARVAGERPWRVIAVEILPNLLPVLASQFVFAVIAAILGEAGLSFLGLGASNSSTLGTMLFYAQNGFALAQGAWWWFVPPGLLIALLGMGLSLVNFSIDEVINPRLANVRAQRRRERRGRRAARRPGPGGAARLAETTTDRKGVARWPGTPSSPSTTSTSSTRPSTPCTPSRTSR
jgi:peptide/nickel transport system permease protein